MLHHIHGLAMSIRTMVLDAAQMGTLLAASEMDANSWVVVIAAIFLGISQVVQLILGYLREKDKLDRETRRDRKVEQVAVKLEQREAVRDEKLSAVADKVEEIKVKQDEKAHAITQKVEEVKTHVAEQVEKAIAISPSGTAMTPPISDSHIH